MQHSWQARCKMVMEPLPAVLALILATSLLSFLLRPLFSQRRGRLPPGPTPWPVVGSLLTMLRHKPYFRWVLSVADGKDITCIRLGRVHVVVVNSPELGREFLKKHDASFASRPLTMATEYSSCGYLSVAVSPWGDQWKKMRRVLASEVLSSARFQKESTLRAEEADHFTRYLRNLSDAGAVVDVRLAARYYSGNLIRRMLFGVRHFGEGGEHGGPGEEEVEHVEAAVAVLSCVYSFCPSDFVPWLRCLDLGGHERIMKRATASIYKYHDPIIDRRLQKWRRWRGEGGDDRGEEEEVEDILDIFLSLKDDSGRPLLSIEEIRAQCAELIYTTVDNPPNVLEWALSHMIDEPDIFQKAVDELDQVVGKNRLVQESDFARLPYLRACAREALRLHPVVSFNVPHVAMDNTTVAGYFIPKDSMVLLSRVGLGRNPKIWNDAIKFQPERYLKNKLDEVELAEPNLQFISFSTGRRQCIAGLVGASMIYMLLGRMIQAFDWSLPHGKTNIDLSEEKWNLFKAKPLYIRGSPRLEILKTL